MALSARLARPIGLAALIAASGVAGCVYEPPGYGGYDYGGYGYGGGQSYGGDQYYGGGQYYGDGGGQYYGNRYGYRPYGHRYDQPRYAYPHRHRYRHGGDYCDYNRCNGDDDND